MSYSLDPAGVLHNGVNHSIGHSRIYNLPMSTYYTGSTYLNRDVRLCKLHLTNSSSIKGELIHQGDFNYPYLTCKYDFSIQTWGAQDNRYHANIKETNGQRTSYFAFTSDGSIWFRNNDLWEQSTTLIIHRSSSNVDFSGTGSTLLRSDNNFTFHTVNAGSIIQREDVWGS